MPVVWNAKMSTGNELIDQDHRYLICLFNSIELALSHDDFLHQLPLFFQQLFEYTKQHFLREERIQLKISYPGYLEHKIKHQEIVAQLEQVNDELQRLLEGESDERLEVISEPSGLDQEVEQLLSEEVPLAERNAAIRAGLDHDILTLARSWVLDHIIKTDLDMAKYLKQYPSNFQ